MEFLFVKRKKNSDILRKHTNQYPQKLQLTVELSLQKPTAEKTERITVYFNTNTVSVYHTGLSDEAFTELVDSIVTKIVTFSSHGSGRQLLSINKVTQKLARFVPVNGISFQPFPEGQLLRRDSNLQNIHNGHNGNCFLYCYTAV